MTNILKSLFIVAAVAAVAGGATYAWFSDAETITGSTFSSGSMALKIDKNPSSLEYDWSDGFAAPAGFPVGGTNIKPGSTGEQILDIMNEGGIDGYATIDLNRTSEWSDLAGKLNFRVYFDGNHDGIFEDTGLNGTVDQYTQAYNLGAITGTAEDGAAGALASVKIVWSVPTSAGNEIQGDSITLNVVLGLNQVQ